MNVDENGREFLSFDEALALLADGDMIHTFRAAGPVLIGGDWDRDAIIAALRQGEPERTGPMASAMKHGLALTDAHGVLFIATKPQAVPA
ncbi:MAG: hypothetical protein KAX65_14075 [Caldilineaceae bacterium]|nr:hypothetical protein [Caldilineaceae bacterium]